MLTSRQQSNVTVSQSASTSLYIIYFDFKITQNFLLRRFSYSFFWFATGGLLTE